MEDNKASRMFLVVAVVLGVLATLIAFSFIKGTEGQDRGPKAVVVVASHDLRPGASIDPERDFKLEEIPAKFASFRDKTIDPGSRENYKGQKVNRVIRAGQPVFLVDFAAGGEIEWTSPNERAMNIKADPGLAIPGDHVKIMTAGGQLLAGGQDFRIIAIGGIMRMIRQPITIGEQSTSSGAGSRAVTIEVTEAQAAEILKGMGPSQDKNYLLICPPAPEHPATSHP